MPKTPAPPITDARFAAIDFETADRGRDSACAIAVVTGTRAGIDTRFVTLLRPPRQTFEFTYIHHITWKDVQNQPTFAEIWPRISPFLEGADFIAAHNASFDRGVMTACCQKAALPPPPHPYLCTVRAARLLWDIRPTTLAHVCNHFNFPLNHHEAESDAIACAQIVRVGLEKGIPDKAFLKPPKVLEQQKYD